MSDTKEDRAIDALIAFCLRENKPTEKEIQDFIDSEPNLSKEEAEVVKKFTMDLNKYREWLR